MSKIPKTNTSKKSFKKSSSSKQKINNTEDLKQKILTLIRQSDYPLTKNQIVKALDIRGDDRIVLKQVLRDLQGEGSVDRGERRRFMAKNTPVRHDDILPAEIVDIDDDGEFYAEPLDWDKDAQGPSPRIRLIEVKNSYRQGHSALSLASRVAIKILSHPDEHGKGKWTATIIRRLVKDKMRHLGVFYPNRHGGTLSSVNRKDTMSGIQVGPQDCQDLEGGDVVQYTFSHGNQVKILKKLGKLEDSYIFSEIAIYNRNLPHVFSEEAEKIAGQGQIPLLGKRTDYRHLDLVTIDGEDARDFDDAVWAIPDEDPHNQGGWRALVAIADVSYYVRQGTSLDEEAYERGNSVYFPDRVVPMLPEALSNEMCSLKPHVDRACLAVEMLLTKSGRLKSFRVKRGLMRSKARLTYGQVQRALDGTPDDMTSPLLETVLRPLYGVYQSLLKARQQRGTLELDMPERQILFDDKGAVSDIVLRERYDSHKIIEELMIAANVAAAKTLEARKWPCLYRIHDEPDRLRVANLQQFLKQYKIKVGRTDAPSPQQFNDVLGQVKDKPIERMVNELVLRTQAQAKYSPENIGHFGLSLTHYAHFTSPIRRYSDLLVHRYLVTALELGEGGVDRPPQEQLAMAGEHLSQTEREAAAAEREVVDRFAISYVASRVGDIFDVVITGVNRAGLFVEIPSCGAEGFVPKSTLGLPVDSRDRGRNRFSSSFYFDEANHQMVDRKSKVTYQLGDQVQALLFDADTTTNSMTFRLFPPKNKKGDAGKEFKEKGKRDQTEKKGQEKLISRVEKNPILDKKSMKKKASTYYKKETVKELLVKKSPKKAGKKQTKEEGSSPKKGKFKSRAEKIFQDWDFI